MTLQNRFKIINYNHLRQHSLLNTF
jgi:hypothetical protein